MSIRCRINGGLLNACQPELTNEEEESFYMPGKNAASLDGLAHLNSTYGFSNFLKYLFGCARS